MNNRKTGYLPVLFCAIPCVTAVLLMGVSSVIVVLELSKHPSEELAEYLGRLLSFFSEINLLHFIGILSGFVIVWVLAIFIIWFSMILLQAVLLRGFFNEAEMKIICGNWERSFYFIGRLVDRYLVRIISKSKNEVG